MPVEEAVSLACADGVRLGGHFWRAAGPARGAVVVNAATGVLARYYHRYARFLSAHGFHALTYDYRGIGASRPASLRGCGYRWHQWGTLDCDAALRLMRRQWPDLPLHVVGHSIGGFLPGFAPSAPAIGRILTVGAQYAYWRDYRAADRAGLFLKWHVAMPLVTALCGYFPGRRLGWLEDLPAGVANEWSFRRARMERSLAPQQRAAILARFAAVRAPILAVIVADDPLGTAPAIRRALRYYRNAPQREVVLAPDDLGVPGIGHFGLFHARFENSFWADSLAWLGRGADLWSGAGATAPGHDPEQAGDAPCSGRARGPA
ncbi:alpha/beta hydrolase family protein [Teichococcus oryzae]|uniref:Alpha/beta fold hydrolase n=1 Tax=Teichococcus oryzae TaxID=1608942 RepID=A0A5B2TGG6_9PROT|nr:alpha/beta fold hydrolase [Pseudoroseomonas oryzae]KAA2213008.1 alpha/beta fold hydrolase [Pseudoroseomonas oryzae]